MYLHNSQNEIIVLIRIVPKSTDDQVILRSAAGSHKCLGSSFSIEAKVLLK